MRPTKLITITLDLVDQKNLFLINFTNSNCYYKCRPRKILKP